MSKQAETARADRPLQAQAGGRMVAVERRLQIVKVAMRLFSERGFRGTTTKEIAHAAGVSEAIIFRHFATKEELYTAIIDYKACAGIAAGLADDESSHPVIETIRACVGDAMERRDDREVFRRIALAMMEHHARDHEFLRLLLYSALEGHQLAQIFWDKNVRVLYEFLGGYVRERQREGAFRDVDPFVAVRAFNGAIIHHSLNKILWERDAARCIVNLGAEEAAGEFTEILLRGIVAETGAGVPSLKREKKTKRVAAGNRNGAARNKGKKK
ncbi:MAG TPA: TetR/AcrR family transcriptional regulator [Pyrinomonadaceae bacterium]|jgi:AcrR family transcriptional regulator|nr:TetR/AcrR family transcriptional regulator [Pyrinomonadaceae bacterium]